MGQCGCCAVLYQQRTTIALLFVWTHGLPQFNLWSHYKIPLPFTWFEPSFSSSFFSSFLSLPLLGPPTNCSLQKKSNLQGLTKKTFFWKSDLHSFGWFFVVLYVKFNFIYKVSTRKMHSCNFAKILNFVHFYLFLVCGHFLSWFELTPLKLAFSERTKLEIGAKGQKIRPFKFVFPLHC